VAHRSDPALQTPFPRHRGGQQDVAVAGITGVMAQQGLVALPIVGDPYSCHGARQRGVSNR
jgi:hypothetical protein